MAGFKTISIMLLIVLVALAVGSPAFATDDEAFLTFTPPAACPGERVTFALPFADVVGGGISVAAVSPLGTLIPVISSDPVGLIQLDSSECSFVKNLCTFVVSESATCGGHYTVTVTLTADESAPTAGALGVSSPFDVPSTCCPVGGCVQPVNTFALLSPWLAVIGLVGCIGTVVVVAKKRHP